MTAGPCAPQFLLPVLLLLSPLIPDLISSFCYNSNGNKIPGHYRPAVLKRLHSDDAAVIWSLSSSSDDENDDSISSSSSSSRSPAVFPVLEKISGINWEGSCRYVDGNLVPATSLTLKGGIRFDIRSTEDAADTELEMNSFLTFPNGKTREVRMRGKRGSLGRPSLRLDGGGPIYMVITELDPDTVLINEVEQSTGNIVMTSGLSLITSTSHSFSSGGDDKSDDTFEDAETAPVNQLIQVSHEVGKVSANTKEEAAIIEGHQIWRFRPRKDE